MAQHDAETRFRALASKGSAQRGWELPKAAVVMGCGKLPTDYGKPEAVETCDVSGGGAGAGGSGWGGGAGRMDAEEGERGRADTVGAFAVVERDRGVVSGEAAGAGRREAADFRCTDDHEGVVEQGGLVNGECTKGERGAGGPGE